jgi:glycosyltransferase involved in cell wall biosynthesis
MTHVIYDHQVFSWQEYGGISRYFYELARRVNASEGFAASIIAPLHVNRYLAAGGVNAKGIRMPVLPRARRAVNMANRYIESALLKMAGPGLVHETYYQWHSSAPKGCPVVVTVHDMIPEKCAGFSRDDETSAKKRAAVTRADRVVCVSENTRRDLIELFDPDPKKIRTIHLGFTLTESNTSSTLPPLPKPYFLYVGMRGAYKNFDQLLRAYASNSMLQKDFDLIAFGSNDFTQHENACIRDLGLTSSQVRHLSGDDAVLGSLYRNAVAFVYPSLYEGFGIPPLEAMASGCPVLCSNTSSIPEVVGDAGLYFDPNNVEAIADAMLRTASLAELRLELVARGNERIGQFSWDRCAVETIDLYRDLIQ